MYITPTEDACSRARLRLRQLQLCLVPYTADVTALLSSAAVQEPTSTVKFRLPEDMV